MGVLAADFPCCALCRTLDFKIRQVIVEDFIVPFLQDNYLLRIILVMGCENKERSLPAFLQVGKICSLNEFDARLVFWLYVKELCQCFVCWLLYSYLLCFHKFFAQRHEICWMRVLYCL